MHRVRVGILSREFFAAELGRMGGFGFAARVVAETLAAEPGFAPVLLSGAARGPDGIHEAVVGDTPLVFGTGKTRTDLLRWRRLRLDAILTIDWHSSFVPVCRALPRTPLLLWSRDPRSGAEWDNIATLRLPGGGDEGLEPTGADHDAGPVRVMASARRWRRPMRVLLTDEFLVERFRARFGIDPVPTTVLGTPVDAPISTPVDPGRVAADGPARSEVPAAIRAGAPYVLFLGRLDPIKRPWVFGALAAAVPDVQFVALGQQHLDRGWRPEGAANLHWLGHVDGPDKATLLAGAVATMNTSIHEAVPLSLLESLHHATPVLACLELGGLTARFGVAVPPEPGDGMAAVPALADGVRALTADPRRRAALGHAGRAWVQQRHSQQGFRSVLATVLAGAGIEVR